MAFHVSSIDCCCRNSDLSAYPNTLPVGRSATMLCYIDEGSFKRLVKSVISRMYHRI